MVDGKPIVFLNTKVFSVSPSVGLAFSAYLFGSGQLGQFAPRIGRGIVEVELLALLLSQ